MRSAAYIRGFMDTVKTAGAAPLALEKAAARFKTLPLRGNAFHAIGEHVKSLPAFEQIVFNGEMAKIHNAVEEGVMAKAMERLESNALKGLPKVPYGRPVLPSEELLGAKRDAVAGYLRKHRTARGSLLPFMRRVFRQHFPYGYGFGDGIVETPMIQSMVPIMRS